MLHNVQRRLCTQSYALDFAIDCICIELGKVHRGEHILQEQKLLQAHDVALVVSALDVVREQGHVMIYVNETKHIRSFSEPLSGNAVPLPGDPRQYGSREQIVLRFGLWQHS